MKNLTTSGLICLEDDYHFVYKIARIDFTEWEDGHFKYSFHPYYTVIDMLPSSLFQGLPGLDLSLRRACYERENIVPVFISERSPSENREELWQLLEKSGLNALNRLEWLIRTNTRYSGDNFFVKSLDDAETAKIKVKSMYDLVKRSDNIIRKLLEIICYGDCLSCEEISINDATRSLYYKLLMPIYVKDYNTKRKARLDGIERAVRKNAYHGRTEIQTDPLLLDRIIKMYLNNEISADDASLKLGMSRSSFFRRLRKYIEKN